MNNFDFCSPTRIIFGRDTQKKVGDYLAPLAKKVLLHYGGGSIKKSGLYDEITASLDRAGVEYVELGGVVPNPRISLVYEGIELCKKESVDLILAVGGGSAIDSAKAIAIGFFYDGDVWEVYDETKPIDRALPVATVLTIPAAGSESSNSSVITNEKLQLKFGYNSELIRPVLSVVNPELFFTLPGNQAANGVADMMSHIFERYFTNTLDTDLTDGLCESTLKTIIRNAPKVLAEPQSYEAWCEIGFAGNVAHNGLLGMGREQDWASHAMEHELSAIYDVAHGAGLAVLTPAWMRYIYKKHIDMFTQFAVNVMGVTGSYRQPEQLVESAIDKLQLFFKDLGLPTTLRDLGIGDDNLEVMAQKATDYAYGEEHPIGGIEKLRWQDVLNIYNLAK